jgi:plasmid maintenance system killer protein
MHASIDNFRHFGAPSKLRKQAFATIGAVQPATVSEWLNCVTLKRFDKILGARVGKDSILMVARIGR